MRNRGEEKGLASIGGLLEKTGNTPKNKTGQKPRSTTTQKTSLSISQTATGENKPALIGPSAGNGGLEPISARTALTLPQDGGQDLPPHLQGWKYSLNEPPPATATELEYLLDAWTQMIAPCGKEAGLVMLEQTLAVYKLPENWDDIAWMYLEALEDIPEDLAKVALKHVRQNIKWFPKPVEIREPAMAELAKRKAIISRIQTMKMGLDHFRS